MSERLQICCTPRISNNKFCIEKKNTLNWTNWFWNLAFFLSADTIWAKGVFDISAVGNEEASPGIRIESEPGAVGVVLAVFEALKLVVGGDDVDDVAVGALAGDETLQVRAVSQIWKCDKKK